MKLSPHAQKLADDWLARDGGDLRELADILGIARGGIGWESCGHCYQEVRDEDFSPHVIESFIDNDARIRQLAAGQAQPTAEELAVWRQARRDAQEATRFYIWKVPFSRGARFICTVHQKNGYVVRADGPFHSIAAALPCGEIVWS